jgi:hypothetical protein
MKICVLAAGFLLIASCVLAADIDGKWSGQYNSGMGDPMTLTYTFKANGNTLTGTSLGGPDGKEIPIKDGKIDGNNISFKVDVEMEGMGALKFKYKGVLSGEELKLSFEMEMPGMGGGPGMGGPGGGGPGGGGPGGPGGGAPKQEFTCKKVK